jgi:hypothetical protein
MLYHLSHVPSFFCFHHFSNRVLLLCSVGLHHYCPICASPMTGVPYGAIHWLSWGGLSNFAKTGFQPWSSQSPSPGYLRISFLAKTILLRLCVYLWWFKKNRNWGKSRSCLLYLCFYSYILTNEFDIVLSKKILSYRI